MFARSSLPFYVAALFVCLSLAACDSREEKEAKYLSRGNTLFEQGQYEKAALEYRNAGRIDPTNVEVRYRLGLIAEAQSDLHNAFIAFMATEQQDPHYVPVLLKLSQFFLAAEQNEQAQKRIDAVLAVEPGNAQAHALRAALLYRQKMLNESEREAHEAQTKDPENILAYSTLVKVYEARGADEQAATTLEEAIVHNPKELSLYILKAIFYESKNNLDKIAEAYRSIFALKPDASGFRSDLADIYARAGKPDEGEKVLRECATEQPKNNNMQRALITYLDRVRGYETARAEIQRQIQTDSADPNPAFWLVDLDLNHGKTNEAISELKAMIEEKKADSAALTRAQTTLARIYYMKSDKNAAQSLIDTILDEDAGNADALFIRSQMAFERGDYDNAIADARSIVRDHPKATGPLALIAEILKAQGHVDLAIDTLNQILAIDPANTNAQIRLAQNYSDRGETQRALALAKVTNEAKPDDPIGWENTARIALVAKQWPTMEKAIQKLESIKGQEKTALFLKAREALSQDKPDEARDLFRKIVLEDPKAPIAEYALSALSESARTPEQVKSAIDFILSLNEQTAYSQTLLGEMSLTISDFDKAASYFDQAIAKSSTQPSPYLNRARLWIRENKTQEAIAVLRVGAARQPNDLSAKFMIADIQGSTGNYDEAINGYREILKQNPSADIAANNLAQLVADARPNDVKAMDEARLAAERFISSPNPLFLDTLAWIYFRQGNLSQAQAVMERVLSVQNKDNLPGQIHYHNGAILAKIGRKDEAKAELEKALADKTNYSGRAEAEALLKGL